MNSKSAINVVGILLLYLVWAAVLYLLPVSALGPTGDADQAGFLELFRHNALIVLGVSFACMLVWFALGEWAISAWAESRTWHLSWAVLLIVVLGTAIYMSYLGPKGGAADAVNGTVACYYVLGGVLTYYVASVCFSPTNAKYAIWPAKLIRRW